MEQLKNNLSSHEIVLEEDDIKKINELTKPVIKYPQTFIGLHDEILLKAKNNVQDNTFCML